MENRLTSEQEAVVSSELMVQQTLELARRLKERSGGSLNDEAISAVSDALGVPEEYVRTVAALDVQRERVGLFGKMRATFQSLRPSVRQSVTAALVASLCGLSAGLSAVMAFIANEFTRPPNLAPICDVLKILFFLSALYNVALAKDARSAIISGAIFGGFSFALYGVIVGVFRVAHVDMNMMLVTAASGGLIGWGMFEAIARNRPRLGLKDAVKERQALLQQLVDIQERLRAGEQSITFMSVDIVGSTKMKESADPLSVEYTFNEYHHFIDMVTRRYGGRVHSTAGDGVTCAFDTAQQAYGAGRNIQSGLIELNTHRNRIGAPIRLRVGIHAGKVVAPDAEDITTVNFAHVIDVAAHIQKHCPVGCVAVSESAGLGLPGGPQAVGDTRFEVEGMSVFVWRPKSGGMAIAPVSMPPLPQ